MKNIQFTALICYLLFSLGCNQAAPTAQIQEPQPITMAKPGMIHTVFFWLNEDVNNAGKMNFEQGLIDLGKCPQIQAYYWGPVAPTEARGVIDNTYAYAINVHFATLEDEKAYQSEPLHLKFIDDHKDKWAKVVVYDNLVK